MIWLICAALCLPVILMLLRGGRADVKDTGAADHYRAQLREIEAEAEKGILTQEAAATVRLEIERRILRLADQRETRQSVSGGRQPVMMLAAVFLIVSLVFYHFMGSPGLQSASTEKADLLAQPVTEDGLSYGEALSKIEKHLQDNPKDIKGWEILATSARGLRQFSKAANAFEQLAILDPEDSNWRVQQLEAYIAMANGQVTPAAGLIIDKILADDPAHPAGHYYKGMSHLLAGREEEARAIWRALAERSGPDAPWMPAVNEQLRNLGDSRPPALTDADRQMVDAMDKEERDLFIQSMMDRLKARLESNPDDVDGWLMLARSQATMGDKEAAIATLKQGIALVDESKQQSLRAFLDNLTQ